MNRERSTTRRGHGLWARAAVTLAGAALATGAWGAEPRRLTVPLSSPGRPARVDVALVLGSIEVGVGDPGQVVIEVFERGRKGDDDDGPVSGRVRDRSEKRERMEAEGLHRVEVDGLDLAADEEDNSVKVRVLGPPRAARLRVLVPADSSLRASTVNSGEIEVEGVGGELELHNTNGSIRAVRVRGPVTANTVNGDVEVVLSPDARIAGAMALSTLNGDIDLTLPGAVDVDLRVRTDHGDIYSDFDVELEAAAAKKQGEGGRYRISIAKELAGRIGKGGPEVLLKSFNGDIVLRRGGS